MEKKPIIEIKPSMFDLFVTLLGYLAIAGLWIMTIGSFDSLPEQIPIHYNGLGEVDNYGKKVSIFILPIIGTCLFLFLTILSKNPKNFNYYKPLTQENAAQQYSNSIQMIRYLKLTITLVLLIIVFQTIQIAQNKSEGFSIWFLPLILGLIFIPIAYFGYKSHQLKK